MKNLYTFSKNSWHVKFFNWLFRKDATQIYKTMCPYFWTYVLIIIFLPIILFVRMFGAAGSTILDNARTYSKRKEQTLLSELKDRFFAALNGTDEDAYQLSRTKCWKRLSDEVYYKVDYEQMQKFREMRDREMWRLRQIQRDKQALRQEAAQKRDEKIDDIKDSIFGKILGYTVLAVVVLALGYVLFILFRWLFGLIDWTGTDWSRVGRITLMAVGIVAGVLLTMYLVYLFIRHLLVPFFIWTICHLKQIKFPKLPPIGRYIAWPFVMLWKLFVLIGKCIAIVCDMIYNFYKKRCPVITWKE